MSRKGSHADFGSQIERMEIVQRDEPRFPVPLVVAQNFVRGFNMGVGTSALVRATNHYTHTK